jgi:hypothetical protein
MVTSAVGVGSAVGVAVGVVEVWVVVEVDSAVGGERPD